MKENKTKYVIDYVFKNGSANSELLINDFYKNFPSEVNRKRDSYMKEGESITEKDLKSQIRAELTAVFSNKKNLFDSDENGKLKCWGLNEKGIEYYNNKLKPKTKNEIDLIREEMNSLILENLSYKEHIKNMRLKNDSLTLSLKDKEMEIIKMENEYLKLKIKDLI